MTATVRQSLTELFRQIKKDSETHAFTVGHLLHVFNNRSYALLVFFLIIPSLQPIPIPGLGSAFGVLVAIQGLAVLFSVNIWLPKRLANIPIKSETVHLICDGCCKVFSKLEKIVRPRLPIFSSHPIFCFLNGVVVFAGGLILSLPLVLPLSNFIPSIMLLLICLGLLEEDGLMILLSYIYGITLTLIATVFGQQIVQYIKNLI